MPEYPGVYVDEVPFGVRSISGVSTSTTGFVGTASRGPVDMPVGVGSFAEFAAAFGPAEPAFPMAGVVRDFFVNGGTRAVVVRVADGASTGIRRGVAALDAVDRLGLLCIPPAEGGADAEPHVYREAAGYCASRRAMLLVDPLRSWSVDPSSLVDRAREDLEKLRRTIGAAENAALYLPRVVRSDTDAGAEPSPLSGAVAGVIARTDAQRGVWQAPAGMDASLAGVADLETRVSDADNEALNRIGVNCLRSFPEVGPVVWGARTLAGADELESEWKYVPVRRLALFIEKSLDRGTTWVVFEPNDEPLWSRVRSGVEAFLHGLFEQGAFAGDTPRESYFVKCDASTMTQDDIDSGIVRILIGIAPLRPAEFVAVTIEQVADEAAGRYRSFRFRVHWRGRYVAGFAEINEPSPKTGWATSANPVELRRGVTFDREFDEWARGGATSVPADVVIEGYDEAGHLASAVEVSGCRTSEFQAIPDLDASAAQVTIQTLSLQR